MCVCGGGGRANGLTYLLRIPRKLAVLGYTLNKENFQDQIKGIGIAMRVSRRAHPLGLRSLVRAGDAHKCRPMRSQDWLRSHTRKCPSCPFLGGVTSSGEYRPRQQYHGGRRKRSSRLVVDLFRGHDFNQRDFHNTRGFEPAYGRL